MTEHYLRLISGMTTHMAASDRFDADLGRALCADDLAMAMVAYSTAVSDSLRLTHKHILTETAALEAWQCDVERLRGDPSPESIWRHLVIAMRAIAQIFPQIWRYAKLSPEEEALTLPFHEENTRHFTEVHRLVSEGHVLSLDEIDQTMRWCNEQGCALARRTVVTLVAIYRPDALPSVIHQLQAR